ncbi:MAG: SseB family protein [Lachnospiraceae bacterium]|nr:SseB family protein [Lachnospiraceae bacterium]MCI1423889.1 SseB family protein [Lachnospiraceae bacterium]MCI1452706.1 SseB family protein [Lachnospiraceae bacterium]
MSGHYEDPYLEKNREIEAAIAAFDDNKNQETLAAVLAAFMKAMSEDGHLLLAVDMRDNEGIGIPGTAADPVPLDRDASYVCQTLRTGDGRTFLAGFTSHEELHKGADTDMISDFMKPIFTELLTREELAGILINPWGEHAFVLTRDMIAVMLGAMEGENDAT